MNVLTKLGLSRFWQLIKARLDELTPKTYTFVRDTTTGVLIKEFTGELRKSFASVKVGDIIADATEVALSGFFQGTVISKSSTEIHVLGETSGKPMLYRFSRNWNYDFTVLADTSATTALESKLTELESTVASNHTAAIAETKKYLPLTGGTLTGALTIKMNYPQLTLQQTGGSGVRITTGSQGENFDLKTLAGGYVTTVVGDLNFKTGGWLTYNADTGQFNFNKSVTAPNIPAASAAALDTMAAAAFDSPEADAEGAQEKIEDNLQQNNNGNETDA